MTIKTPRSKTEVINSLEEIASFKGDSFRIPVRVFGNKLFVRRKFVVGKGTVTNDHTHTIVMVTLSASGQSQAGLALSTLIFILTFIATIIGFLGGNLQLIPFLGISVISLIPMSITRIVYFFAAQLQKESLENLILHGD